LKQKAIKQTIED